ncbi:MAG: cytidylyltransferase domain-containing protein [Methylovirgula sp.]
MLALIPARGGSKGLPGKNIRPLLGKPLIAYSIEAARAAANVTRVVVSTDSEEIATVARQYGAEIPFMRPPQLATDTALALDNYVYTLNRLSSERGAPIEEFVVLLPTAPLRTSADIDAAISLFRSKSADSVISYYEAPHPLQWHRYIDDAGVIRALFPEGDRLANRQKERPSYLPNGAIYVFKSALLIEKQSYYSDRTFPYIMPAERSVDIDTLLDFEFVEFLLSKKSERAGKQSAI